MARDIGILFVDGTRLAIEPLTSELPGSSIVHRGIEYQHVDDYIAEWLAITAGPSFRDTIGIRFDLVCHKRVIEWFRSRRFDNVIAHDADSFHILFASASEPFVPGWPFLPPEAYVSDSGDYLFLVVDYYEPTKTVEPTGSSRFP